MTSLPEITPFPRPLLKCEICSHVRLLIHPGGPEQGRWRCSLGGVQLKIVDGSGCGSFEREPGVEG